MNIENAKPYLDLLLQTPVGEKLDPIIEKLEKAYSDFLILEDKNDETGMNAVKAATMMTFAVLRKLATGKKTSELTEADWKEIATSGGKAVLLDNGKYTEAIFGLYEKYIRYSATMIKLTVPQEKADEVLSLADELAEKAALFESGALPEVRYTEDCLWISLEAMVKLLASTAFLVKKEGAPDKVEALASFAFEYGRLMLFKEEQALLTEYVEGQYCLDQALEEKYAAYSEKLEQQRKQFYSLLENAFSPDFRTAFLASALLAKGAGVEETEILNSMEDVDAFFMD